MAFMNPRTLSRQSGIPLYYQLKEILRNQILSNVYKEGDLLPPENELRAIYEVSRQVARRALAELALEGLVISRKGVGSFVNRQRITKQVDILAGFTRNLKAISPSARIIVLRKEIVKAPKKAQSALKLGSEEDVVLIERAGFLDQEPFAVLNAYYRLDVGKFLLDINLLNQSIYNLLEEYRKVKPYRAEKILSVVPANFKLAASFDVREAFPLICHFGTTYGEDDLPFEYSEIYYRSDRVSFAVPSFRRPESGDGMVVVREQNIDETR